jgi:F-type H+-transporting ATPase subunit b
MDNPLVQTDPGLFIWTIVTFLVLLALLAKYAWRPLLEALEARQNSIRKSLDDAQTAKQELERLNAESSQIIARARVEADAIITQSRSDGDRLRDEIRQKARAEADNIVKSAERQIQLETTRALEQIRHEAVDLGDDCLEDHPAQPVEGRQPAPDRRGAAAGGAPVVVQPPVA